MYFKYSDLRIVIGSVTMQGKIYCQTANVWYIWTSGNFGIHKLFPRPMKYLWTFFSSEKKIILSKRKESMSSKIQPVVFYKMTNVPSISGKYLMCFCLLSLEASQVFIFI